jgi:hypothetical protein
VGDLPGDTPVDVWLVAEDTVGNLQPLPIRLTLRTADVSPPRFLENSPSLPPHQLSSSHVTLRVSLDEPGRVFFAVVRVFVEDQADGQSASVMREVIAPTAAQLREGAPAATWAATPVRFGTLDLILGEKDALLSRRAVIPPSSRSEVSR